MHYRARKHFTAEQYLTMEERAETRSEFYQGEIFALAGGSVDHNTIAGNAFSALHQVLRGKSCRPFTSDVRLLVQANGLYTYPDVMVVCGPPLFHSNRTDTITNPLVIVEVLSESTRDYDRGFKFELYRALETLRDYVLIDSAKVHVECYHRMDDGRWALEEFNQIDAILRVSTIGFQVRIGELYDRVEFGPAQSRV